MLEAAKTYWVEARRLLIILCGLAVATGAVIHFGHRAYLHYQPEHLARQARMLSDKGNYSEAYLLAWRALGINGGNVEACRLMAEITERMGSPKAVEWRQQITNLCPHSLEDALALARTAAAFGDAKTATDALERVKEQNNAEYEACAGEVALALGKPEEAEVHYDEAVKLEPHNNRYAYDRAVLQLRFPEQRDSARSTLANISKNDAYRIRALSTLLEDSTANYDWESALPLAKELAGDPKAAFKDQLTYLDVLSRADSKNLPAVLKKLQNAALSNPDQIAALLLWMQRHGRSAEAIKWVSGFPPEIIYDPKFGASLADPALALCYLAVEDWSGLQELAGGDAHWGDLEYLRLFVLARSMKEREMKALFTTAWRSAVAEASKHPETLRMLLQIITQWGWSPEEKDDLLWAIVTTPNPDQKWALEQLYQSYNSRGQTEGLYRVACQLSVMAPSDDNVTNNVILFSLLLKKSTDSQLSLCKKLYARHVSDPVFISTYAFALYSRSHPCEALTLMNTLQTNQLEEPSTAAYYAIILVGAGAPDAAKKYFDLAEQAKLLPEEQELLQDARMAAGQPPR